LADEPQAKRPNVLFVLTDDQRWDALGCAGHEWFKSPHLDRLAKEGVQFTNAFVTTSLCSPSRASMLSGVYAHRHKVLNNFTDYPEDLPNYPRQLQAAGYETAYIGKWHMGEDDDRQRPGFDHWMSHKGQGNYWDNEFNINGKREVRKGYYTRVVSDAAIDWLKQKHDKPWCLVVGQKAPHGGPIIPEPKYEHAFDQIPIKKPASYDFFKTAQGKPAWIEEAWPTWHGAGGPLYNIKDYDKFVRAYYGTLGSVDESMGQIYDTLKDLGVLDDTLIIFTSDNGFVLGEHGRVDKRVMYEPSIRIPLVVRYPKLAKPGTVIDHTVLSLDLAPSILDICGAPPLANINGKSFKPLLQGSDKPLHKSWLYEYNYEPQFAYTPNVRGIRTDTWKYIRYPHGDGTADRYTAELYNLAKDPHELRNLIDDPAAAEQKALMETEYVRTMKAHPESVKMLVLDEGIKLELPKF
jgi:N-acetylglucosamine-6-sulfatase